LTDCLPFRKTLDNVNHKDINGEGGGKIINNTYCYGSWLLRTKFQNVENEQFPTNGDDFLGIKNAQTTKIEILVLTSVFYEDHAEEEEH
jgi:hypothetical protein